MRQVFLRRIKLGLIIPTLAFAPLPALCQEGQVPSATSTELAEGVYLLEGLGCNVLAVTGPDGVLIIDTGYKGRAERLKEAVASLGSGGIKKAIFTHIHWDHLGASESLGLDGVELIAHENTRQRMTEVWRFPEPPVGRFPVIQPYPEVALPSLTFSDTMNLRFGGQGIRVVHFPAGHSDGDAVVFFPDRDVVHTGDVFLSNGFPLIDVGHGGTIDGYIRNVDALIEEVADETVVIPGHRPPSNREGLRKFRSMLTGGRDRIAKQIDLWMTLEQVLESDPTVGLFEGGDSYINPQLFVWMVFLDLTGQGR